MDYKNLLFIGQMICIVLVIILVLIQNRGASLSSSFGGNNEVYLTRRGIEKFVVYLTTGFGLLYLALTVLGFYIL
jgi:protein translocase SecG subunit